jgi:hypothetical protein
MQRTFQFLWLLGLLAVLSGCSRTANRSTPAPESFFEFPREIDAAIDDVLANADVVELWSINTAEKESTGKFQFYNSAGFAPLKKDTEQRERVLAAVRQGIREGDGRAFCFEPRHALRAVYKANTVEIVICFECSGIDAFLNGKCVQGFTTASSPEALLNQILKAGGVPLAPK